MASKKKANTIYRVSAVPRSEFEGFWRSGIFFPNAPAYIELTEQEMTDAIMNETMLIIQVVEREDGVPADGE